MPINLFQGADPSIVTAATRAYSAAAPQSYARTFENVSAEYGRTMQAQANMWGDIARAGASMYNQYKEVKKQEELGLGGKPNTDYYREEAKKYRKEKWETRKLPGGFFGEEARDKRREINEKKQKLYNTIEAEAASYDVQKTLMETADPDATGPFIIEQTRAIQTYMNGGKATELGNYVLPEEVDGQLKFKMYHDPKLVTAKDLIPLGPEEIGKETSFGKDDVIIETDIAKPQQKGGTPIIGSDGEEITFNISDINKGIIPSDEGLPKAQQVATAIENILTSMGKMGDSNGDPLNEYQVNQIRAGLKPLKENRAAWYADNWAGEGGKSFHKELTSVSVASANLFGQLEKIVPEGQEIGDLKVLGGVKDVDGNPGITVGDFQNSKNYAALTAALFNPGDKYYDKTVTGNLFEEHMMNKMNEVRTFAWENSQRNPANNIPGGGNLELGSIYDNQMFVDGKENVYVTEDDKRTFDYVANSINKRGVIGEGKNTFIWDKDKQTYFFGNNVVPNKKELFESIFEKELTDKFKAFNTTYINVLDWDGSKWVKNEEFEKRNKKKNGGWKEKFSKFWTTGRF